MDNINGTTIKFSHILGRKKEYRSAFSTRKDDEMDTWHCYQILTAVTVLSVEIHLP